MDLRGQLTGWARGLGPVRERALGRVLFQFAEQALVLVRELELAPFVERARALAQFLALALGPAREPALD